MRVVNNRAGLGHVGQDHRRAKCLAAAIAALPLFALPAFGTATAAEPQLPALGTATAAAPEVFDALRPGARVLTLSWGFPISLIARGNDDDLRGEVCEERTCERVSYPWLDRRLGVALLDYTLNEEASPGQQIIFGYSQGARVANGWLDKHAGTADAPTPDELSLVLIGNPGRKYGGGHVEWGQPTPATDYSVLDVSRQYDLGSDVPDDRFNLLAMANAFAGFGSVHMDYADVDIYDPANYVWTEGNTTYVFVPAKRLPILDPLYILGLTDFADSLDAPLRAAIEKAYDRSYLPAQPGLPPAEAEPEPEGLSAGPDQAVVSAVASPSSRRVMAQDRNDTENLSADSADSRESESGSESDSVDVAAVDVAAVDVAVMDAPVGAAVVEVAPMDASVDADVAGLDVADADAAAQHGDPEGSAAEGSALDSEPDEGQGVAAAVSEESDSPQLSSSEAVSSSDSDTSTSDEQTSSGSQSPPGDESSPEGDE